MENYRGELAALAAACLWAASSVVYTILGQRIQPLQLNIAKGIIAIAFIFVHLIVSRQGIPNLDPVSVQLLLLSGAIGIGLGDTAYFSALNYVGARLTLLIETLAPPVSALLALIFLDEKLSAFAWCGILLTILGIAWVITERNADSAIEIQNRNKGIFWAVLAALTQAIGAVLSRSALTLSSISPLWSTLWRLFAGVAIAVLILLFSDRTLQLFSKVIWTRKAVAAILLTAFASTYLGILLQQVSLKYAPAGIAQTLSSTSPLFVLPLVAVLGDRISLRTILGVSIAIIGIGILFSFGGNNQ